MTWTINQTCYWKFVSFLSSFLHIRYILTGFRCLFSYINLNSIWIWRWDCERWTRALCYLQFISTCYAYFHWLCTALKYVNLSCYTHTHRSKYTLRSRLFPAVTFSELNLCVSKINPQYVITMLYRTNYLHLNALGMLIQSLSPPFLWATSFSLLQKESLDCF